MEKTPPSRAGTEVGMLTEVTADSRNICTPKFVTEVGIEAEVKEEHW